MCLFSAAINSLRLLPACVSAWPNMHHIYTVNRFKILKAQLKERGTTSSSCFQVILVAWNENESPGMFMLASGTPWANSPNTFEMNVQSRC